MSVDARDPATTVDSLLRAVARAPSTGRARLVPGTLVADNFEVLEELGRGGMGIVYRAHDRRLDRDVALKVLHPERWDRLPRATLVALFEREARATARLEHPGIVALHEAGAHEGSLYLVLQLVRGRTLAAHLTRPMSRSAALTTVRAIADAVAHAHGHGVLHRDLKPQNVLVDDEGHVRVLDFGLATLQATELDATRRAGTPMYMAPEQRTGAPPDPRTDVWGLGLLLYQTLTAYAPPPFDEPAALEREPWTTDLARLPPDLSAIVRRAVAWDVGARFPDVASFRAAIDEARVPRVDHGRRRRALTASLGLLGTIGLAAGVAYGLGATRGPEARPRPSSPTVASPVRFEQPVASTEPFASFQAATVAVAPDGRRFVFVGRTERPGASSQLFLRELGDAHATPIPNTEDAEGVTFSPDGRYLAYARNGVLVKRSLEHGDTTALAPAHAGFRGVTWTERDELVYAPSWFSSLYVVSAEGGDSLPLTALEDDETSHRHPHALPSGDAILFVVETAQSESYDHTTIELVERDTGARRAITIGGAPRFVPPDLLLVPRAGALHAFRFDPRTRSLGPTTTVVDDVVTVPANGAAAYDVAGGTLVHFVGGPETFATEVIRVDAEGAITPIAAPHRMHTSVRVAPDGRLLLRDDGANAALWIFDPRRETDSRLTWGLDADHGVLSPDGAWLHAVFDRAGESSLVEVRADGSGEPTTLFRGVHPSNLDASRDGTRLFFDARDPTLGSADVFVIALDDPARPVTRCVGSEAHETQPAISPNGRWLAYTSSASGRDEIYVEGFPEPGLRVPISAHGGRAARWNAEGTRLVFRRGPAVISVAVETRAGRLHVGPEEHRFDLHDVDDPGRRTFDLDGDALLTVRHRVDAPNADRLRVVVGWTAEPAR
jgi:Tol biopolymer transport system component